MKLKRDKHGKFIKARKGNPSPGGKASSPKRRRRRNASSPAAAPTRRRRRRNPSGVSMSIAKDAGIGLLAGLAFGAVSHGADKMLDPKLVAHGWKRGAMDLGAGLVLTGIAAFTGMRSLTTAAASATGTLAGGRFVEEIGDQQNRMDRANAVLGRIQEKIAAEAGAGKGSVGAGAVPRRRALPGASSVPQLPAPGMAPQASGAARPAAARVL